MKNESLNNPFTWLVALVAALAIGAAGVTLDGPTELEAAQAVADTVTELEYTAIVDNGGVAFCAQFGRTAHPLPNGDLICRAGASVVAQGGQQ